MPPGRLLITIGLVLVAAGLLVTFAGKLPLRLGRLPGDIGVQGKNFSFYFPLTTCILLSAVVTLVFWILRR
jgi:formate hydrogenlyase subunit 3/multisubunit Na+/H+ antiporter MnhD subunit